MRTRRWTTLGVLGVALSSALPASCGGRSEPRGDSGGPDRQPTSAAAMQRPAEPARPAGGATVAPGYSDLVRGQPRGRRAARSTPCGLVTRSEAATILGAPILQPREAPQGPTCIYRTRSGEKFLTLAVQSAKMEQVKRRLRGATRVDIGGRATYCGVLGRPVLYVAVQRQRVLTIGAPCRAARRFAAQALSRLGG